MEGVIEMVDEEKLKEAYRSGYSDCKDLKAKLSGAASHNLGPPDSKLSRYAPYDSAYRAGWWAASKDWDEDLKKVLRSLELSRV